MKYEVEITRTRVDVAAITVTAKSEAEAEAKVKAMVDPEFQDLPPGDWEKVERRAARKFSDNPADGAQLETTFEYLVNEG